MYYPGGRPFDFLLDPSETLTFRLNLTPDRVSNKGKGVYRLCPLLRPFLDRQRMGTRRLSRERSL